MDKKTKPLTETQISVLHNLSTGLYELRTYSTLRNYWNVVNKQSNRAYRVLPSTVKVLAERGLVADIPTRYEGDYAIRVGITDEGRAALAAYHEREG